MRNTGTSLRAISSYLCNLIFHGEIVLVMKVTIVIVGVYNKLELRTDYEIIDKFILPLYVNSYYVICYLKVL